MKIHIFKLFIIHLLLTQSSFVYSNNDLTSLSSQDKKTRDQALVKVISLKEKSIKGIIERYRFKKGEMDEENYFPNDYEHFYLLNALFSIGDNGLGVLRKELFDKKNTKVQKLQILYVLGAIGTKKSAVLISDYLKKIINVKTNDQLVEMAIRSLGETQEKSGFSILKEYMEKKVYLRENFGGMILTIAKAFSHIGNKEAIHLLEASLLNLKPFDKEILLKSGNLENLKKGIRPSRDERIRFLQ
jgi:hypothetical protein